MGGIVIDGVRWLFSKTWLFVLVFLFLLLIFFLSKAPGLLIEHLEERMREEIVLIESGKVVIGRLVDTAHQKEQDITRTLETLQDLEAKRRALEGWLKKFRDIFPGSDRELEAAQLDKQIEDTKREKGKLQEELEEIRVQASTEEEEMRGREVVVEDRKRQIKDLRALQETISTMFVKNVRSLAWKALFIVLAIIVLPFIWRILAFHFIAPLASRSSPVRLLDTSVEPLDWNEWPESTPAAIVSLSEDVELLIKEKFLAGKIEDSEKRTRYIFDRAYPFTSLASGLFMLTAISRSPDARHNSVDVTVSCQVDSTMEVSEIRLKDGDKLCFQPSSLVGIVYPITAPPRIRSIWVFNRLHAWLNLRFRYLVIEGPVRLILGTTRGVKVAVVDPLTKGYRFNSSLTVAFSPALSYGPIRAETFWAYFRGANPLFDDFFSGRGILIVQRVGGTGSGRAKTFWEILLEALRKIFGL